MISLLSLSERFGKDRLEAACRRALFFGMPLYVYVKSILNAGLENDPLPGETPPPPPKRTYRHERNTADFFEQQQEVASC